MYVCMCVWINRQTCTERWMNACQSIFNPAPLSPGCTSHTKSEQRSRCCAFNSAFAVLLLVPSLYLSVLCYPPPEIANFRGAHVCMGRGYCPCPTALSLFLYPRRGLERRRRRRMWRRRMGRKRRAVRSGDAGRRCACADWRRQRGLAPTMGAPAQLCAQAAGQREKGPKERLLLCSLSVLLFLFPWFAWSHLISFYWATEDASTSLWGW